MHFPLHHLCLGRYCQWWAGAERRVYNQHEICCWVALNLALRSWDQPCAEYKTLHCLGSDMKAYLWVKISMVHLFFSFFLIAHSFFGKWSLLSAGSTLTFPRWELNEYVIYTCSRHCSVLLRPPTSGLQLAVVTGWQLAPTSSCSHNPREEKPPCLRSRPFPRSSQNTVLFYNFVTPGILIRDIRWQI